MRGESMFKLLGDEKSLPEKAFTLGAIGMGVGFGTCGLSIMVGNSRLTGSVALTGTDSGRYDGSCLGVVASRSRSSWYVFGGTASTGSRTET